MSKHLRTFLLSVLVVVLAASSAMAAALTELNVASTDQISITKADGTTSSDWTLQIKKDGFYVLPNYSNDKEVQVKEISLDYGVKEAELRLPVPYDGEGVKGNWNIKLNSADQTLRIVKNSGVAAAIALMGDPVAGATNSWSIPRSANLTIDVPIRAEAATATANKRFAVSIDIAGTFTFGPNSDIYGYGSVQRSGFVATDTPKRSTITVKPHGLFIVQSPSTLQGALDVYVKSADRAANDGVLRIDVAESSLSLTGTNGNSAKAKLTIDGVLDVQKDITITGGEITVSSAARKLTKKGSATLTLGAGILDNNLIHKVEVLAGTLNLNGSANYSNRNSITPSALPSFNSADVTFVVDNATLQLAKMSVRQKQGGKVFFDLSNSANLVLADHAVYATDTDNLFKEIYPYEDYFTKDNSMRVYVDKVSADISSNSTITINNGVQAFTALTGSGTVTVNGTEGTDEGVLLIKGDKTSTANGLRQFEGTINGTNGNLGLFMGTFAWDAFRSADITADNLIVYGYNENDGAYNTMLVVSGDDTLDQLSDVSNIYLRSDRPGAADFPSTMLTIGKLQLASTAVNEDANGNPDADNPVPYTINSIKIDSTHVEKNAARFEVDSGAYQAVNIEKLELYANKATDFAGSYNHPDGEGMYAFMLGADDQAKIRYTLNGDAITGDGDVADVDVVDAIQILEKADVIVTGTAEKPFGSNNSVLVKSDGKLEVPAGSTIDGNLTFEASTNPAISETSYPTTVTAAEAGSTYPQESWFYRNYANAAATEPRTWNDNQLDGYTIFTTGINYKNRRTNEGGIYSVNVTGNLLLSADEYDNANYPGRVLVRVKPALDLLYGTEGENADAVGITHIGERFKVIGAEGEYNNDPVPYVPVYNSIYQFRIAREGADTKGVTLELRDEVGQLFLRNWEFVQGGDVFGLDNGHNFQIKIFYDLVQPAAGTEFTDTNVRAYFGNYVDGIESRLGQDNVLDATAQRWFSTSGTINVSNDITFRTTITRYSTTNVAARTDKNGVEHTGFLTLTGTSYQEKVKLVAALSDGTSATRADRIVPAYKVYTLVREGTYAEDDGINISTAATDMRIDSDTSRTAVIESKDEEVKYFVDGMRKAPAANASVPEFNGTSYVWVKKAAADTYVIKDAGGQEVRVNNVRVILYDGAPYAASTVSYDVTDSSTVEEWTDGISFNVLVSALRSTGGKFNVDKALAILASREDGNGEITTSPVTFQLYSSEAARNTTAVAELDSTVYVNGMAEEKVYDINYSDLGIGLEDASSIHLIAYDFPNWLTFTGHNDTISYTIDTANAVVGNHTFSVLAYAGDNTSTSAHARLYTFNVNVNAAVVPTISVSPALVEIAGKDVVEMTFTVANATNVNGVNSFTITNLDNAPSTILSALRLNIVGDTSTRITANAEGINPGTYRFHVEGYDNGTLVYNDFVIVVNEPRAPSVAISAAENYTNGFEGSPVAGYTYRAVFSGAARDFSGDVPAVTYSMTTRNVTSELYGFTSGDLYVVEGIARKNTNSEGDVEQSFTVTAKAGDVEGALENEVVFTVGDQAEEVTYGSATTLAATSGSHTDVQAGYRVMFPTRTTAAVDAVVLPSWLKPVLSTEDESVAVGIEFAGVAGDLANGSKATVRIAATYTPADGEELAEGDDGSRYYGWDVVYNAKPADFTLTASPATVNMRPNATQTVTLTHNALGTVTYEVSPEWATVSGTTLTLRPTELGVFTVTVKATDAGRTIGNTAQATVAVTVTSDDNNNPSGPDEPGGPDEPTVEVPVVTAVTRFSDSNVESADVTADRDVTSWAVYVNGSVETWAAITATGARTARVTLNVPSDLPAGTYAITVTATDANGTSSRTSVGSFTVASTDNLNNPGGSSGGCDAGFGAMALAFATPLFLRRRRS